MKLLEEDEDETMHSGADVEAFTAALNRDIEGDTSTSQPSDSDSVTPTLSQGTNHAKSQLFQQWQTSSHEKNASNQSDQEMKGSQQQEQHSSEMELQQHVSNPENQPPQNDTPQEMNLPPLQQKRVQDDFQKQQAEWNSLQISQTMSVVSTDKNPVHLQEPDRTRNPDGESQYQRLQRMSNQQAMASGRTPNTINRGGKQVPFALLLPVIEPQLDKDRAMQLQALYIELKQNKIPKEVFVQRMRNLVGDQMLKMAVYKLQGQAARNSPNASNQFPLPAKTSAQHLLMPPANSSHVQSSAAQLSADSSRMTMDNDAQTSRGVEHQSDSHGIPVSQMSSSNLSAVNQERDRSFPMQGLSKQQQQHQHQHMHFSQTSFPTYGSTGGNYLPYPGTNINTSAQSLKPQPHDLQMRQIPGHLSMGANQIGTTTQAMNQMSVPKIERQNSLSDLKRVQGGTLSQLANNPALQHSSGHLLSSVYKEQNHLSYVKQEPIDQTNEQQQKSQFSTSQGLSSFSPGQVEQGNAISGTSKDESFESSRMGFPTSTSMTPSNSEPLSITAQLERERHNPPLSITAQLERERHNLPVSITAQLERERSNPPLSITAQLERERHNPPLSITAQLERERQSSLSSRIPSTTSPLGLGSNAKTPVKKPSIGQKKPLEALGSSQPLSGKKQKVSGAFSDQSIEQLNDVTAVSGVNLREEEEQLFSGSKEESRASEASRRVVQEEEERLILQKIPLQKKLAEIMATCGVRSKSSDVERCLSLCVEERIRGLIGNLIRLSKQRVDLEKPRHQTVVTSDVRQQIMAMNRKAREEWEKKQADVEKLQRTDEPEENTGADGDKEKDEGRGKSSKVNKEEDDKMRTTAANVAARAAVGGDDMMSKWQLMAEQARQKNRDAASASQPSVDAGTQTLSTSVRNARDNQEADKRSPSVAVSGPGTIRKFGRNQDVSPPRIARSISIKDVVSVLEREPQMSKSTIIYRLYEKNA